MSPAPRWVEGISKALSHPNNKGKIIYQTSTVDANNAPHSRSQVHRAFMEPNGRPDLPLLVSSTDARSPKVSQVHTNQRTEISWWMDGSQEQFRLSGYVHIFPSPAQNAPGNGPTPVPAEATALKTLEEQGFDFDSKRCEIFEGMSPGMRASWCIPSPPGTPISSYEEQKGWPRKVPLEDEAKTDEDRKNLDYAKQNFALMLFEPIKVDWLMLGVHPNQRTVFTRQEGKWVEQLVVP